MRFTLHFLSFFLVLLAGETIARATNARQPRDAALSALLAKRQTNRHEIGIRSYLKKTVKRGVEDEQLDARSTYPKCKMASARTGYAHYPGWKLVGDELSGALPVKPESACIQACNKYGAACSGVFFDSAKGKCYLKGTRTSSWTFSESVSEDGVDLVGGCALWANIVTEEMDAVCCRG
ncbi:uncharacterized protein MKK02DRAFT_45238 [Dioszegia hungarica]|uniref:Apple domain-containing protein n=1 Tax=Dioszegia hungarica TaxID=4972 RepID=A0AA38HCQ9_9TREE|nr:uncharacterized protein MKK02DRAFT_45238 [Dioszegia hungarica]KAI9636534.1 hypothetical protein MKK02DRAFT_45238 [Dioszegia hungarica]